jgi:hypothetical protein
VLVPDLAELVFLGCFSLHLSVSVRLRRNLMYLLFIVSVGELEVFLGGRCNAEKVHVADQACVSL